MKYAFLALVAFSMLPGSAEAVVRYWHKGPQIGADDTEWNDPDNWGASGAGAPNDAPGVPTSADHAILHNFEPTTIPVITTAMEVGIFTPSWHDNVNSALIIGAGGSLNATGFTRLSGGDNTGSVVNFLPGAGISVWSILQMSFDTAHGGLPPVGHESDSHINLDGGILHVGGLGFSNNGQNTTNIDIGAEGTLLVNGDLSDNGNGAATSWINSGYVTALDGEGTVSAVFEADPGWTRFTSTGLDLAADFDNDGDVDAGDLARWGLDYDEMNDFSDADGDFDSDGSDYLYWQRTFTGPLGTLSAVPEPTCIALLTFAGLGYFARRKRT